MFSGTAGEDIGALAGLLSLGDERVGSGLGNVGLLVAAGVGAAGVAWVGATAGPTMVVSPQQPGAVAPQQLVVAQVSQQQLVQPYHDPQERGYQRHGPSSRRRMM